MPSFTRPTSIRRRFLRIISFGRYSNGNPDDMQPLTGTNEGGRRYSAPDEVRPTYTAQQSYQSSDSAQTTIIHEMPPGAAPFFVAGLRDQYRGRHISDTEFDTPPSLDTAQQPTHPAETTRPARYADPVELLRPTALLPEHTTRHSTRLRRNKSFMQCNVCKRILEYTQFHCPGCAARTLHHVPGSPVISPTSRDNDEPKTLHPRKGRQNQCDGVTEESSWDTQGLEAGTAEGSWATIAGDVEGVSADRMQESSLESSGIDEGQEQEDMFHEACHCCCGKARFTLVHHCCCGTLSTHGNAATSCTRSCTLRVRPITAVVIVSGTVHEEHASKYWRRNIHHRHICCQMRGGEHASIVEEAIQGCGCAKGKNGETNKKKTIWWMRWSKWFCCC
jgi:hypothetical protein